MLQILFLAVILSGCQSTIDRDFFQFMLTLEIPPSLKIDKNRYERFQKYSSQLEVEILSPNGAQKGKLDTSFKPGETYTIPEIILAPHERAFVVAKVWGHLDLEKTCLLKGKVAIENTPSQNQDTKKIKIKLENSVSPSVYDD